MYPEIIDSSHPWKVTIEGKEETPRVSLTLGHAAIPKDCPPAIVRHELAHVAITDRIAPLDTYDLACEDARVNLWLQSIGRPCPDTIPEWNRALETIERLFRSEWKMGLLCALSLGVSCPCLDRKKAIPGTKSVLSVLPKKIQPLYSRLLVLVQNILYPNEGRPIPGIRARQLAQALREALNPPLWENANGTGEKKPEALGTGALASVKWGKMSIRELPLPLRSKIRRTVNREEGFLPTRFDRLPIDGKVFQGRRRSMRKGTVLLDCSSSCRHNREHIPELLARIPFGRIAYYSGEGKIGTLSIAADKGRMAKEFPLVGGNNTIDGPALEWLLKQPTPRFFVTDEGYTAPNGMSEEAREELSGRARSHGVSILPNCDSLLND